MSNTRCKCTYDPDYHRQRNSNGSDECPNRAQSAYDLDVDLCLPCLFGCAP